MVRGNRAKCNIIDDYADISLNDISLACTETFEEEMKEFTDLFYEGTILCHPKKEKWIKEVVNKEFTFGIKVQSIDGDFVDEDKIYFLPKKSPREIKYEM